MKSWLKKAKQFFSFQTKTKNTKYEEIVEELGEDNIPWWGNFLIEEDQSRFFKIGNIILCLDRYNKEWHITVYRGGDIPSEDSKTRPKPPYKSFAAQASNEIALKPALPDRSLLSQLDHPFYIPIGETLLLYISSPLWIRMEAGKPFLFLDEIPTEVLADTWFGRNTLEGELCYANKSHCSPRLEELPRDNTRVITPVLIVNRSRETLLLRELKVPLPYLGIYSDAQHYLWTEQLNVYQEDQIHAETTVVKGAPKNLKDIQLIHPARFGYKPGLKNLFSSFMWK